jgi:hypothetical protein
VTADELCQRLGISKRSLKHLISEGYLPHAHGHTRRARYGMEHILAFHAYRALKDHNVILREALALCKETGLSLTDYVHGREAAIRQFGLGVG